MTGPNDHARVGARTGYALLVLALIAGVTFCTRELTDETALSFHGDMPRHMMNGVFLWDLLSSGALRSVDDAMAYAREYYVRYPALSLGHHPPLLAVLLVPFYAVFGVSVFSARLAIVVCIVVTIAYLFSLARRIYGPTVAGWTALLFAVQPFIVPFGQQVMTEALELAIVLAAVDALLRFCRSERTLHYGVFVVLAVASLYAKQLAALLFPLFAGTLAVRLPSARLLRADVVTWTAVGVLLSIPAVVGTILLSPYNVEWILNALMAAAGDLGDGFRRPSIVAGATSGGIAMITPLLASLASVTELVGPQTTPAILLAMLGGVVSAVMQRDARIIFSLAWLSLVIGSVAMLIGSHEASRYAVLAVPAYCLCAASLAADNRRPAARRIGLALLVAVVVWDGRLAARVRPTGGGGYETLAAYAVNRTDSPTVLYSGSVDTGYFVFFGRKHAGAHRPIIMRADKMLTTSMMATLDAEEHIERPSDIYQLLERFGTRLVVIEDRATGARALDWLRTELQGDRFVERMRSPITTQDRRLAGVDLVAYEYLAATPPATDAVIDTAIPLIGRDIRVKLSDLMGPGGTH